MSCSPTTSPTIWWPRDSGRRTRRRRSTTTMRRPVARSCETSCGSSDPIVTGGRTSTDRTPTIRPRIRPSRGRLRLTMASTPTGARGSRTRWMRRTSSRRHDGRQPTRTLYHRQVGRGRTPEASYIQSTALLYSATAKWTNTLSDRWLIEAGFATTYLHWRRRPQGHSTGTRLGAPNLLRARAHRAAGSDDRRVLDHQRPDLRRLALSAELCRVGFLCYRCPQPQGGGAVRRSVGA